MSKYLLLLLIIFASAPVFAQRQFLLSGRVTDNRRAPVSYASIYISNTTYGTSANEDGRYQFKLNPGTYTVVYRSVGYLEKRERITISNQNVVQNEQLRLESFQLQAVTVNGDTTNPGARIMRQVINRRKHFLNQVKQYSCVVYIKGVQRLISAPKVLTKNRFLRPFTRRLQIDTNGRGVLYQSESLSTFSFEQPNHIKEVMLSSKVAGQSNAFSFNRASDLQYNFYQNYSIIAGVSPKAFISPVADNAMEHYSYRLVGTSVEEGSTIYKILVTPTKAHDQAYRGFVYIVKDEWRIAAVDMYITKQANINFVDTLNITQQFVPVRDTVWLPLTTQYTFNGDALGIKFKGYYLGVYNNYNINPDFGPKYFNGEVLRIDTNANYKSNAYWNNSRPVPLTALETRDYRRKDSVEAIRSTPEYMDSLEGVRNKFRPLRYVAFGYQHYNRDTRTSVYINPIYDLIYYNTVQGWSINPKFTYLKGFNNRQSISITPSVRYGFSEKKIDANASISFNYDPDHKGYWFLRGGSDVFDLSNVGTRSAPFNTVSTLLYGNNYVKYYRSQFGLIGWQREVANGVVVYGGLSYANRQQLYNTSFNRIFYQDRDYRANSALGADGVYRGTPVSLDSYVERKVFDENQALTFKASVNITFDQQYQTRPEGKLYEPSRLPVLQLTYRKGIHNVVGSDVDYDFVSATVYQNRINFGLYGYSSYKVSVGSFLNHNALSFMDYNHFLGNQGTVFNPDIGNFHYLPFYAYSANRSFLEAHYEHNFTGFLLGQLPYVRRLKLETIAGLNYLTNNNAPIRTDDRYFQNNNIHNYIEGYVGIKRFFFRVDYGVAFGAGTKFAQGFRIFYGIK